MSMVNVGRYSIHGASGNHYKVPCETTRIQWKVAVFFFFVAQLSFFLGFVFFGVVFYFFHYGEQLPYLFRSPNQL